MSVLDELEQKRAKVLDRRERVAAAEQVARESPRRGEREREKLLAYHRECGESGKTPDIEVERELGAELAAATGGLVVKTSPIPYGNGSFDLREELVDPLAEARLEGARAALRDAEGELAGFIQSSLGAIAVERIAKAVELAEACDQAMEAARKAANEYEAERAWWSGLLIEGKQDHLIGQVPENLLGEMIGAAPRGGVPLPLPEPFVP